MTPEIEKQIIDEVEKGLLGTWQRSGLRQRYVREGDVELLIERIPQSQWTNAAISVILTRHDQRAKALAVGRVDLPSGLDVKTYVSKIHAVVSMLQGFVVA